MVLPFCTAAGFILLVMELLNAGVEWRYTCETAPVLCMAALLLVANMVRELDRGIISTTMTLLLIAAIFSFAVSFLRAVDGPFGYMLTYHPEFYYRLERAFSFWK